MSKTRTLMTSFDASLFDSDTESEVASAFEADPGPSPDQETSTVDDREGRQTVYASALRNLLVSTTCLKS